MILLAVGDVVGEPGLRMVEEHLHALRVLYSVDLAVVNGENADLLGIRPAQADRLFMAGADVVTLGNHTWNRKEIVRYLDEKSTLLRPANFPPQNPGAGCCVVTTSRGARVGVMSLVGRCLMDFHPDSPFSTAERLLPTLDADVVVVDIHAEATSEKAAMAYHLDGRAQALFGTHTHVQTADERILPGGLGFITDLGMTGPVHSVLGVKPEQSLAGFRGDVPRRFEAAGGACKLEGALFDIDEAAGRCRKIQRVGIM
ncbi:MAG: YmdB family metallophosphoesterase [Oscillospiraceae bacterium]|nr:YmdB family metallophosphoesterase [Oscillospiraceae bacterium]